MRETLPTGTPIEVVRREDARMGLVVACDIWGLRPLFDKIVADLSARWQMSVAAVEPFPGADFPSGEMEPRVEALSRIDDGENLADLVAAADSLGTPVTGLMGFCMGGMYCHKAARSDRFPRIVSFYGMIVVPEAWRSRTQGEPLAYLINGYAESVLAILGDHDIYTPLADIDQLRSTGATCVVYPGAEHGFAHDPSRPSHRPGDAADAFSRAGEWLLSALG